MLLPACLVLLISVNIINAIENLRIVKWTVRNQNGSIQIPGKVPGGIYSDLHNAGIIGDILYRDNDVLTRWVAYDRWTYEGRFTLTSKQLEFSVIKLVLHGVDTIAFVEVNDKPVGYTVNMFVRFVYDIKTELNVGENIVRVSFASPVEAARKRSEKHFAAPECVPQIYNGECHVNQLRKMQASFSWDWGPAFPSVGLWKPAVLELYNQAIIRSVTTHVTRTSDHWLLKVIANLEADPALTVWTGIASLELQVEGAQKISIAKQENAVLSQSGNADVELNLTISQNIVREWWPNGYGDQPLYRLKVSILSPDNEEHYKIMDIGFRTIELVEEDASNIFNASTEAGKGLTFYFKVNDYPIFMKGSNWIPSHILPEFSSNPDIVEGLLESARDAHMNMLRVWGGGIYEWEYFYKLCDQKGLLVWQDFPFACSMYPTDPDFIETVKAEVEQNIKRIQYHPSIAVWAGNNENEAALVGNWYDTKRHFEKYKKEYIKLYVDTIKPIVETLDPTRRYLVSSPSNGRKSEQDGYIAENPYDSNYGDTHYYNYFSDNWDFSIYPRTRFASEYGFQSLPSIKTLLTATKELKDFNIKSEFAKHRQHSPMGYANIVNQIKQQLKLEKNHSKRRMRNNATLVAVDYFKKLVFYSQITQAMSVKTETEFYRQSQADWYTMGAMYWQLNDVWQAPSWSGIEYGNNWKMLHYFAMDFFAPVLVSPRLEAYGDVSVYLTNDRFVPIEDGQIIIDVYKWNSLKPNATTTYKVYAAPLRATKQDITIPLWRMGNLEEIFLKFSLDAEGVESPTNYVFPKPLKDVVGLGVPNIQIAAIRAPTNNAIYKFAFNVKISVDTVVLFFWMDTSLEHGYFEQNGVHLTEPVTVVNYMSKTDVFDSLKDSITYQYYTN